MNFFGFESEEAVVDLLSQQKAEKKAKNWKFWLHDF